MAYAYKRAAKCPTCMRRPMSAIERNGHEADIAGFPLRTKRQLPRCNVMSDVGR